LGGEEFFITKIKEGLSFSSDSLTQEEENFLGTKLGDLLEDPNFTPEFGQRLQAKCIGALSEIYARDTAGNRQAAVMWRENNEHIYNHSELSLSGIVQNWYLSVGRAQEKKASGCSSMFVWLLIPMLFVVVGSVLNGCQNQLGEGSKVMTSQEGQKTALEVLESRAVWRGLPRQFLETLAQELNSVETARSFALLCEETGILENNILTLSQREPKFALFTIAVTLTSYANTMGEQGELMKAKEGLEFALILESDYVPAWLSMAIVSVNLGDCTSAIDWADKSLNFQPDPNSENSWEKAMAATENFSNEIRDQMEAIKAACK